MNIKDIMTRDVVSIEPDASILQAIRLMIQHRISGVVVVDKNGDLAGVVSEGDFPAAKRDQDGAPPLQFPALPRRSRKIGGGICPKHRSQDR